MKINKRGGVGSKKVTTAPAQKFTMTARFSLRGLCPIFHFRQAGNCFVKWLVIDFKRGGIFRFICKQAMPTTFKNTFFEYVVIHFTEIHTVTMRIKLTRTTLQCMPTLKS
jgi:hypothetical protein